MPTCHGNSRDARGSASAASAPPNMPVLMNMLVPAAAASSLAAATRRPVRGNCRVDVDTTAAARDPLSARTECVNETADEAAFFFRVYGRAGSVCIALRVVLADAGTPVRSTGPKKYRRH